jgi:DNA-binding CsgD family transcriptional regulator
VKSHMAHIYAKCNIHTRSELDELLGIQSNAKDEA